MTHTTATAPHTQTRHSMTTHTDPRTTTYSEFAILIPCRTDDPDRIPRLYHDSSPRCSSLAAAPRHSDGCHLPPSPCGTRVHFTLPTHPITSPSLLGVHQAVTGSLCLQSSGDGPGPGPAHGCTARRRPTHPVAFTPSGLHTQCCSSSAHTPHTIGTHTPHGPTHPTPSAHTPQTTRQHHAAHGTPFTPHAVHTSRRPRHAGTPQFTRDWTRNPSGV